MKKNTYTAPQRYAVEAEHGNILVSAAAGSGKTFTLSAHINEIIRLGKAEIGEILVVTFSRAAAADMKRKIAENLKKAAAEAKNGDREEYLRLSRASVGVQSANISTIHSFLYKMLKRYFSEIGLPQDSRLVSNQAILERLRAEVLRDTIDELFERADEDFLYLADTLATVCDTSTADKAFYDIAHRLMSNGLDASAIGRYAAALRDAGETEEDIYLSVFGDPIRNKIGGMLAHHAAVLRDSREDFALCPGKCSDDIERLLSWLSDAEEANSSGRISELSEMFSEFRLARVVPKKAEKEAGSDMYKTRRNALKLDISRSSRLLGKFDPSEMLLSRAGTLRVLGCMEKVIGAYLEGYAKKKRDLAMLDFGDLETFGLRLLLSDEGEPTPLARDIGSRYKYIFIDEFQDTNSVQDAIFRAISSDARRFMVGDIKQAIYRFRGADPTVFAGYRERWEEIDPERDGGYAFARDSGRTLMMSDNFRSDEPVTQLTNAVSELILPHGNIPYTDGDRLICSKSGGRDPIAPPAEVVVIEKKSGASDKSEDDTDEDELADGGDPEAEYVAARIADMLGRQVGERIIGPGDIAVLLRTNSNIPVYKAALSARGIPVFVDRVEDASESPAVMLLMCLLNFADNPLRDVYCAGALRSPVFGFTLDDIIALRGYANKLPLYLGLIECSRDGGAPQKLREKCESAREWVQKEKTVLRGMSPSKYLEYLTEEIELFAIEGVRKSGVERDAVNRFFAIAAEFENSASSPAARTDISAFIDYAEEALAEEKNDEESKNSGNAVSIISIHKSKGLEFPVVFVAGCNRNMFGGKIFSARINFDTELGIGMYLPDESGLATCNTFFNVAVVEKMKETTLDEEMRILYVALSRAKNKLIVTAKLRSLDKLYERVELNSCAPDRHTVRGVSTYIDWILTALRRRPQSRVTVEYIPDGECAGRDDEKTAMYADGRDESADTDVRLDGFVYRYEYLSSLPSKLTVSKLSPNILDEDDGAYEPTDIASALDGDVGSEVRSDEKTLRRPAFMTGERYATAAERGSATHVFMQFADFKRLANSGARAELDRLVSERFISAAQAQLVNLKQIERFVGSLLMDKLLRSAFVKREFRFNVRMPAELFTRDTHLGGQFAQNGATVTVQGVVDCVFRDPNTGELTLIDYKTDQTADEQVLIKRHKNQLSYYRDICSEMFGEPIPHAFVYSTAMGRLVEIK